MAITPRREYVPPRGGGVALPSGGCVELVPSLDGTTVSISSGYSDNMIPEIGGTPLNDPTPPTLTVAAATTLWLLIDWTVTLTGTAPDKTIDSVLAENARFVLATSQTEVYPSTDGTTATNGLQAVRWADFVSDGGGGYVMSSGWRCGSHQLTFCEDVPDYVMRFERLEA